MSFSILSLEQFKFYFTFDIALNISFDSDNFIIISCPESVDSVFLRNPHQVLRTLESDLQMESVVL